MLYMDFVLRVALSMVLGFLIGLERQLTGHPAGIRINVLICMGTSFLPCFPCCMALIRCSVWEAALFPAWAFYAAVSFLRTAARCGE